MNRSLITTILLAAAALPLSAAVYHYSLDLTTEAVPGDVMLDGAEPRGSAMFTVDSDTNQMNYSVAWTGLTGDVTMLYIGGPEGSGTVEGSNLVWALQTDPGPVSGSLTFNEEQEDYLLNGVYYIVLATDMNPDGELQAQIARTGYLYERNFPVTWSQLDPQPTLDDATPWGWAAIGYDSSTRMLTLDFTWGGLTGDATGVMLMSPALEGDEAQIAVDDPATTLMVRLSDAQEYALLTGQMYLQVNTDMNPAGELRGQVLETQRYWTWSVPMTPEQEIPAPELGTATPMGHAFVVLDTETNLLSWQLTYDGLTGPVTAAHFHAPATTTQTAGPMLTITETDSGATEQAVISDALETALVTDNAYINLHTAANGPGEIRGQVMWDMGMNTYAGALTTDSEPHVVDTGDSDPAGFWAAHYDPDDMTLFYWVEWADTTGDVTAGHIHGPAVMNDSAPPVYPLDSLQSPVAGSETLTAMDAYNLKTGLLYINLHTSMNPAGELRGQILPDTWNAAWAFTGEGMGYYHSLWFGAFWGGNMPWIYRFTGDEWVFTNSRSTESMDIFVPGMGWVWTASFLYPLYYDYQTGTWADAGADGFTMMGPM